MNFNESTNNRLESFFQKLKSCVTARISIKDLITKFLGLVASQRTERTFKNMTSKVPVFNTLCADEKQFHTLLTPYAFKHVKQQLQKSTDVHVTDDGQVLDGLFTVTEDGCTCGAFQSMGLPCSHLLAWRKSKDLPLYCPDIVRTRWTQSYNKKNSVAHMDNTQDNTPQCIQTPSRRHRTLTHNEKFRKASVLLQSICAKLAQCGMDAFERRLAALETAKGYIEEDKDFSVVELCIQNAPFPSEDYSSELPSVAVEDQPQPVQITSVSGEEEDDLSELPSVAVEDQPQAVQITSVSGEEEDDLSEPPSVAVEDQPQPVQITSVSDEEEDDSASGLQSATFPTQVKKRGRPKGSCTTAIGLPRMKKQKTDGKPLPFFRKSTKTRQMYILKILVGGRVCNKGTTWGNIT